MTGRFNDYDYLSINDWPTISKLSTLNKILVDSPTLMSILSGANWVNCNVRYARVCLDRH